MSKSQKQSFGRIILGVVLFILGAVLKATGVLSGYWLLAVYIPAYLVVGLDVVVRAVQGILHGQVFDENFLMSIATIGAFFVGEYPEAVAVMLFYQVGELFQSYAVGKSRKSISDLMDIQPEYANIEENGTLIEVDPEEVEIGQEIIVKAGEKIPLDGVVVSGTSSVDTSALSGESVPRTLREGDSAISGCINLNGVLKIRTTKLYEDGTVAQILDLVENASSKKANVENFITRFAQYYTPIVVIAAVVLAVIPPLFVPGAMWSDWIYRALTFLVISCPCALVISVPLSFFGGIGGASRQGILVKGSNYLEALSKANVMVFDKTGTLTHGVFEVVNIAPVKDITPDELLEITALAESYSNHPISTSLKEKYGKEIDSTRVEGFEEIPGHGIQTKVDGQMVCVGNDKLMEKIKVDYISETQIGTVVHVAQNGKYLGNIVIADRIKQEAKGLISNLTQQHIETIMLTGDSKAVGESVAKELGMTQAYTELLPADKVNKLEELLAEKSDKHSKVAFVGDGINDAPVLTRADVGIAMGALGSDAAIEASDIVLMDDNPLKIATAINISRKTMRIVKQNIIFALAVKAIVLLLGAMGIASMWYAVFADVGVSVIAILNAMRALSTKKLHQETLSQTKEVHVS